jgi:hypothetical protein
MDEFEELQDELEEKEKLIKKIQNETRELEDEMLELGEVSNYAFLHCARFAEFSVQDIEFIKKEIAAGKEDPEKLKKKLKERYVQIFIPF